MSHICLVCNGMQFLSAECPQCSQQAQDGGRLDDYLGPYSPYREIDELSGSLNLPNDAGRTCTHLLTCPDCGYSFTQSISS